MSGNFWPHFHCIWTEKLIVSFWSNSDPTFNLASRFPKTGVFYQRRHVVLCFDHFSLCMCRSGGISTSGPKWSCCRLFHHHGFHAQVLSSSWDGWPFGHNRHEPKIGGCAPFGGSWVLRTKWYLHPSSSLATTDMGWKWGWMCPLFCGGELGSHLTQCRLGRGLPPYQVASWSIQPKISYISLILTEVLCGRICTIHPAVWPQQTWAENGDECAPFFVEGSWVPI